MKKFLFHAFIFLLPFIILFGLPFGIFLKTGELTSIHQVIAEQKNTEKTVLFGRVYTDSHYDRDYKIAAALVRKPEVLIMGTSRVLGYRSVFFKDKNVFYNAGRSIRKVTDLTEFVNKIPEDQTPRVILVGFDQDFFFHEWKEDPHFQANESTLGLFFKHNWRLLYSDYLHQTFTLAEVWKKPTNLQPIGLNAVIHQKGFRNDGSYYYGDIVHNPEAEIAHQNLKKQSVNAITPAVCRVNYYGDGVRPEAVQELKEFLELAQKRKIQIIGFVSPYSPSVYGKIQTLNSPCAFGAEELDKALDTTFKQAGATFVDLSDISKIGGSDSEFFDPGHYSEKLSLRLLIVLAEANSVLKTYVDIPDLQAHLKASQDNFTAFPQP